MGDPVLWLLGLPVATYKRDGESKHNAVPSRALDVAFLLADGTVMWPGLLLYCAGDEGGRCAGALGRRLAGV